MPAEGVVEKILTSPDNSSLEIQYKGERQGFARWSANIGEDFSANQRFTKDKQVLEGMISKLESYSVDCDGSFSPPDSTNRYSFYFGMEFSTNQTWQSLQLRVNQRPDSWSLRANKELRQITFDIRGRDYVLTEDITFDEIQNPAALFQRLGIPYAGMLLQSAMQGMNLQGDSKTSFNELAEGSVRIKAYNDTVSLHHSRVRVHRLEISILDQYQVNMIVSRVGELFLVELPYGIRLVNDQVRIE